MPKNRKTYKLGDISSVQTGPFGSQLHKKDYVEEGTPIITVEHLGENRITYQNLPKVSEKDKLRLSKYTLQEGDVVFSRVGSVDRRAYVTSKEDDWMFSGRCLRVRPKPNISDGSFLSYYFGQESFKTYIRAIAVGATMPSINTSILNGVSITIPPLPEQRAIASILSAIDDKIENNLAMNKTLEEMAMALYKHWFVDFGPFKEGKFIDSELGKIPEGWEVIKLEDLVEIKYGKDHKKLNDGSIPVFGSGGIMRYVDTHLYDQESVLVPRKGSLNNIFLVSQPFWSVDTMFYTKMKHDNSLKYVYHLLKGMKLGDMDVGSAIPSLTTKLLNSLEVILPSSQVLSKYEENTTRLYEQIWANENENKTLTQLRDTLLPKLISGEVRLKEFKEKITAVL